jgi:hypothetical protein
MSDEEDTEELRKAQLERELTERKLASSSAGEEEFAQHDRRAEKAEYLRRKLEERAESETQGD